MIVCHITRTHDNHITVTANYTANNRADAERWLRQQLATHHAAQPEHTFHGVAHELDYDWEYEFAYPVAETNKLANSLDQLTWSDITYPDDPKPWPIRGCSGRNEPWDAE